MAKLMKPQIMLSPSALNLFLECARCFWLEKVKKIKRPRGIFPSLPGGMDRIIKTYFDSYRSQVIPPPELNGPDFNGVTLYRNQRQLDLWRDWRTGLRFEDGGRSSVFLGAIDDLLVKEDQYIPFDYKTKGSPTSQEDATRYYQNQLDCYTLLLETNKMPTEPYAFLCYYSPKKIENGGKVVFEVQLLKISTRYERARETLERAIGLLKGPVPPENANCEYCRWLAQNKRTAKGTEENSEP